MRLFFRVLLLLCLLAASAVGFALFVPKDTHGFRVAITQGQGMAAVSRTLANNGIVYHRYAVLVSAYLQGAQNKLKTGVYHLPSSVSAWQLVEYLSDAKPERSIVQVVEGSTFAQMRRVINANPNLRHDTQDLTDAQLLAKIDEHAISNNPEGLFFPDSYETDIGSSDFAVYQLAYKTLQKQLQTVWDDRSPNLPYKNPYELLIMASIIEKETGHPDDRSNVAAVFVNRLHKNMRLQTDPTVIYGMGEAYQGNIRKADLQRDTPYNTYTRNGLPPTPIALVGKEALLAATHPSTEEYLYFVSRMDGSGKSQFSHHLNEHNTAVRQYILKKTPENKSNKP
ncbi:endolytic transglycosylase MltG [Stenoxybacter acetivorans]|uniref:endolytic transglycosylase MltG n=1 Tax=Stenoxybacter acetivorans TaxID=422441 RepID=UPI00068BE206|nr:endolytic transglycosylase MltG [Stenoxybacter acetivorans]